jgi:hypothetical protein
MSSRNSTFLRRNTNLPLADVPAVGVPVLNALKHLKGKPIVGSEIEKVLTFSNLLVLLPGTNSNAIISTDGRSPLTHKNLRNFVEVFSLKPFGIHPGTTVIAITTILL